MRENKGVYVTKRDIKKHHKEYQLSTNRVIRTRDYSVDRVKYDTNTQEVGCQYDSNRDNIICTCGNVPSSRRWQEIRYFSGLPKQIYTYHGLKSYTDIGVGSIKTLTRRKVKRIYLPETDDRGVGSSELSLLYSNRRTKQNKVDSYYGHKKTSSKCVGGVLEYNTGCVTSAKLSPIIHTRSGATSPAVLSMNFDNTEIGSNTVEKNLITITTQVDDEYVKKEVNVDASKMEEPTTDIQTSEHVAKHEKKSKETITYVIEKDKSRISRRLKEPEKAFSSDSLVQHVHNLEMPGDDKSHMSMDPMENKLEREYRKMFSIKSKESKPSSEKPIPDFKSTSMLRRRFEALRRGIVKKEDSKNIPMIETKVSHTSVPSCKDVSIASDPPSLEGRSYSNTKTYSPFQSNAEYSKDIYNPSTSYKKSFTGRKEKDNAQWSRTEGYDDESQGVKGMFKIWGKKFNLEEGYYDDKATPKPSYDVPKIIEKKPETVKPKSKPEPQEKKEGRKFFFFKRKSKDKEKQPYKSKKGVTAGRCEVGDGLMIKIGTAGTYKTEEIKQPEKVSTEYEEILRKAWLTKYLSHKIDSRNSVQVRWNNKTYATSSSTIFELMDDVYRETGVVFKSKSEVTTGESSYYKSYTRQRVNFMQNIEAWMIPKTIRDRPDDLSVKKHFDRDNREDIEVRISDQKWFIDKSKAFSHNIEVVLHSNNFVKMNKESSSEYLRIDIPKGFFVDSCSEEDRQNQSSIEEVYKIVEYESTSDLKKQRKIARKLDKGDQASNDIKVTISVKDSKYMESKILETVIKTPPIHRDVVIQGSNVYIPKRCDVIGVGIITQRDLREMAKPILKIQDDEISDEESDLIMQVTPKKCEFAESYLQDYYRNWTPLGIDLFSWCVSDSHLRCCSEISRTSFNYQGDGSKSCPNIYDDFHASAVFSSCATSSCSHCNAYKDEEPDKKSGSKFMKKFKKKPKENPDKRYLPKDSFEVYRKRMLYAESNKGNWGTADDMPYSVPSIEDKCAQKDTMLECQKIKKSCCKPVEARPKKKECKKHVSLPDCETMNDILAKLEGIPEGILTFKGAGGCDACKKLKKGFQCPKHAKMDPMPPCQIPLPPCMPKCKKAKKPACFKPNSPSCNVSPPCTPPCKTPPCQTPPCPPPPCPPTRCPPTEDPCATSSSMSSSNSCPSLPRCSPPSSPSPTGSSSPCSTPSPITSGIKLSSPPHTPPCKPKRHKKPPPPCPQPSPPCVKPPPPCPKPSPPCKKPLPPCPKPSPPCMKPPPPCPKPPPPCMRPPPSPKPPPPCMRPPPCPKPPPPCPKPPPSCPPTPPSCPPTPPSCPPTPPPCPKPPHRPRPCHVKPCSPPPCFPLPCPPDTCPTLQCPPQPCPTPPKKKKKSPINSLIKCKTKKKSNCDVMPSPQCCKPKPLMCPRCTSSDDVFPWPSKQVCKPSSSSSDSSNQKMCKSSDSSKLRMCKTESSKSKMCNKKTCPIVKKLSSQSEKDCNPDCPNRKKSPPPCPAPQKECPGNTKSKISGLFLKMISSKKKTCAKECYTADSSNNGGVIRLSSNESINIKIKKETPSTEEIREGLDIKVQDEDGKTLYERRDYRQGGCRNKAKVLGDLYKDSNVHRMSAPMTVENVTSDTKGQTEVMEREEAMERKSDASVTNLVEIQFKLRVTQGDKTTEINVGNENDKEYENIDKSNQHNKSPQGVYAVKNEGVHSGEDINPNNDINIRIVIKNYKPQNKTKNLGNCDDEFSKKISNKFQTVSTGYSDVLNKNTDNVYSIRRTTLDLTSSIDKSQNKTSEEVMAEELAERETINNKVSSLSAKYETDQLEKTDEDITEKSITSKKGKSSSGQIKDKDLSELSRERDGYKYDNLNATDTDQDVALDLNMSDDNNNECDAIVTKLHSKDEKKEMLKMLFEKVHNTKSNNKKKMKKLRDMLKHILTSDSSGQDDMAHVTSNELAKDVTFASLKPNYFKDTDSMNNYYKNDSTAIFSNINSKIGSPKLIYPTKEDNSLCSSVSDNTSVEKNGLIHQSCMCSALAARLNLSEIGDGRGCCCRANPKKNEETNCDLRNDEDFYLLNYKTTDYADVETQNSNYLTSKMNSANVSIHNTTQSSKLKHVAVNVVDLRETRDKITITNIFSPNKSYIKDCEMKKFNRNTILSISDEDKILVVEPKQTNLIQEESKVKEEKESKEKRKEKRHKEKSARVVQGADILQSYETKKAVLEIYAQKTISDGKEHIVAKLPKFTYERESDISRNYEEIAENGYTSICKRNFVTMSFNR